MFNPNLVWLFYLNLFINLSEREIRFSDLKLWQIAYPLNLKRLNSESLLFIIIFQKIRHQHHNHHQRTPKKIFPSYYICIFKISYKWPILLIDSLNTRFCISTPRSSSRQWSSQSRANTVFLAFFSFIEFDYSHSWKKWEREKKTLLIMLVSIDFGYSKFTFIGPRVYVKVFKNREYEKCKKSTIKKEIAINIWVYQ